MNSACTLMSVAMTVSHSRRRIRVPSVGWSSNTPSPCWRITRSSNWQCMCSSADLPSNTTESGVCAFFCDMWLVASVTNVHHPHTMKTFVKPGWPTSWPMAATYRMNSSRRPRQPITPGFAGGVHKVVSGRSLTGFWVTVTVSVMETVVMLKTILEGHEDDTREFVRRRGDNGQTKGRTKLEL